MAVRSSEGVAGSLHLLGAEHDRAWISGERWCILGNCPDDRLEELAKRQGGLVCVELEIDDDVAGVVHRSEHAMGTHACIAASVTESFGDRPA